MHHILQAIYIWHWSKLNLSIRGSALARGERARLSTDEGILIKVKFHFSLPRDMRMDSLVYFIHCKALTITPKDLAIIRTSFVYLVRARGSACLPGNPELTAIHKFVCNLISTIPLLWTLTVKSHVICISVRSIAHFLPLLVSSCSSLLSLQRCDFRRFALGYPLYHPSLFVRHGVTYSRIQTQR